MKKRKLLKYVFFIFLVFYGYHFFSAPKENSVSLDFEKAKKNIRINDNGLEYKISTEKNKFSEAFEENKIKIGEHDEIYPNPDSKILPGASVSIRRAVKMKIEVDGKKIEIYTLEKSIGDSLSENGISLGRLDKTSPEAKSLSENNITVIVTRINVEEITVEEDIDFKTTAKQDSKLGWREKKIEVKGEKGIREVKYKVTYKNGKEISRTVIEKKVAKEPVTQIEVQGTYVKIGKSHKGQGTWYSFKGGLFAASPWLPMGSYAKVTNTGNGKSVIVQINDRGPFGPGRIIDLDKVAFAKIASIGAGVIGVKVEEVLN